MSNSKVSKSRVVMLAADQKLIDGVQQFLSTGPSLTLGSQAITPAALVQALQARVTTGTTAKTAADAHSAAVKADRAQRVSTNTLVTSLKRLVIAMYAESPDTLGVFGLTAPKPAQKTAASKAAAAEKAKVTRQAHHPAATATAAATPAPVVPAPKPAA